MRDSERYPFIPADSTLGEASLRPYLPITLTYIEKTCASSKLTPQMISQSCVIAKICPGSQDVPQACLVAVVNQDRYVPRYQYPHRFSELR